MQFFLFLIISNKKLKSYIKSIKGYFFKIKFLYINKNYKTINILLSNIKINYNKYKV